MLRETHLCDKLYEKMSDLDRIKKSKPLGKRRWIPKEEHTGDI